MLRIDGIVQYEQKANLYDIDFYYRRVSCTAEFSCRTDHLVNRDEAVLVHEVS